MARYVEPTQEQLAGWEQWVSERPPVIQEMAKKFDPWSLYKMKSTGHRVTLSSFNEDGTVTVNVLAEFNEVLLHERAVFGVNPDNLEPTEVPEKRGIAILNDKEVERNIDAMRVLVRPDLWEMGSDGKAIWKGEGPNPFENDKQE